MKKKYLVLIILGTVIATMGSELLVIRLGGKGRLAKMPIIGDAFNVVYESGEVVEVDNQRYKEVDDMVQTLKGKIGEYESLQKESMQTNERLKNELKRQQDKISSLNSRLVDILLIIETQQKEAILTTAKKYEKTDPAVVAQILRETKDEKECAEILLFMQDRQAAKVIEAYAAMGGDETARNDNAKRIAEIMKLMQKIVVEEEEESL
jgi:predicted ribosome quality control (RQC) complex YloA/Tae2 family protein